MVFFIIAAPAVVMAVLLHFSIAEQPLVEKKWLLKKPDYDRAREILDSNNIQQPGVKIIDLTEKDINIALDYLLNSYLRSSSKINLNNAAAKFFISIDLKNNFFGQYLNINFTLSQHHNFPVLRRLTIGRISIADEFASLLLENIIKHTRLNKYFLLFSQHVREFKVNPHKLSITYQLTADDYNEVRNLLTRTPDDTALQIYQHKLTEIINQHNRHWRLSLSELLQPLFALAYQRTNMDNAIDENRTIIFIVSAYVNNHEMLLNYIPGSLSAESSVLPVYLYKRVDMAKHFIGSAALTASGSGYLAHRLGVEKELRDSRIGSGFSFIDLAADRAGMHFGELATASPESARIMQKAMSEISGYQAFMPEVRDLPENLDHDEFIRRFGSIYSQNYQNLLQQIDRRIRSSPVYADQ